MIRYATFGMAMALVLGLALVTGPAVRAADGDVLVIEIQVAPQTILIGADQATYVTVHADIPYSLVDGDASLTLNGLDVGYTFSDDCGDLVAKFLSSDVKGILTPGVATVVLSGSTIDGELFTGSCEVRIAVFSGKVKG